MGSGVTARSIVAAAGLVGVQTLAACASAPPKPGQSIEEIGDEGFRCCLAFAFVSDTHRIAMYYNT
jgi:hypothetical protein